MFTSIDAFLEMWKDESAATARVIGAVSDAKLGKAVAKGHRSLGRMAWHLAQTIPEMMGQTGLKVKGPGHDAPVPKRKATIVKAYKTAAQSLAQAVKRQWKDATLKKTDNMYGFTWKRGFTLACLLLHQAHHRGQMTALMRMAGLKVPGIYGPAQEDWKQHGMEAPKV